VSGAPAHSLNHALAGDARPCDRRRAPRNAGTLLPDDVRVRVRAGHEATIVDFSRHGILLESTTRLLPGQRYTLQWTTNGTARHASGRVVRAEVAGFSENAGVRYRAALEFLVASDAFWEPSTRAGNSIHVVPRGNATGAGTTYPAGAGHLSHAWLNR